MNAIVLLFLVGLILLGFEVFVPGGLLGLLGGLAVLGGVVLAFVEYGQRGGWTAFGVASVSVAGLLYFEFRVLPRTSAGRRLFLHSAVTGTSQPEIAESGSVVGREGAALTPLSPSGYVDIDGRRYEAFSRSGYVSKGSPVRVVGIDTFRLIVTKT